MSIFKHVLVPTDFGEPAGKALKLAVELATQFGAELTIAHFWDIPIYPYDGLLASSDYFTPFATAAEARLHAAVAEVAKAFPEVSSISRMGSPWEEILKLIEESHADLVVMGTHGRAGLSRFLLGSVAEKVVRASPVPVLTVRG